MGKQRDHLAYWADRKTALHMGRQRDHLAHWQTERPPCTLADRETTLHMGRQRDHLAHWQTERPPCTLADKETALHMGIQRDRLDMGRQGDRLAHWQRKKKEKRNALHIGREKRKKKETPCTWADSETKRPPSRPEKDCRHKDAKRTKHVVHTYRLGVGRGTLVAVVVMM